MSQSNPLELTLLLPQGEPNGETVIFIHGLFRGPRSLLSLAKKVSEHGYRCLIHGYPSTQKKLHEHADEFEHSLSRIIRERIHASPRERSIHLVTHSMGGIVARIALSQLHQDNLIYFDKLIMLTPPNQGSALARLISQLSPTLSDSIIKPLVEMSNHKDSAIRQIPVPKKVRIGIIAAKYDHACPPESTKIDQQTDHIVLNSGHSFIMNYAETSRQVLSFLMNDHFDHRSSCAE